MLRYHCKISATCVSSDFSAAVTVKSTVLWVVTPYISEIARRFRGTSLRTFCLPTASFGILLGLLFDPENCGDMFLRNVEHSQNYTALQPQNTVFLIVLLCETSGSLRTTGRCNPKMSYSLYCYPKRRAVSELQDVATPKCRTHCIVIRNVGQSQNYTSLQPHNVVLLIVLLLMDNFTDTLITLYAVFFVVAERIKLKSSNNKVKVKLSL
jgi:hypothetical protein